MKTYIHRAINLVLPPRCPVSGDEVDRQGMLSPQVWAGLDFLVEPFCRRCTMPFDFDNGTGHHLCGACLEHEPEYTCARAALKYNDTSRDLVLGFKHGDQIQAILSFLPWLKAAGQEFLGEADYIIPVPLHRWRLLARRYNQSAILAQRIGKDVGIPSLITGLKRTRHTPSQGNLRSRDRQKNVNKAFAINARYKDRIMGKSIVLVDDVYTTGSTVNECAKVLKKAGAKDVYVLCIARTVRE